MHVLLSRPYFGSWTYHAVLRAEVCVAMLPLTKGVDLVGGLVVDESLRNLEEQV
jgi:hypothetical protein